MPSLRAKKQSGTIPRRVHLVGAGGTHLSAIGQILLARGHIVTGSDLRLTDYTHRLEAQGATIYEGHAAANLGRAELVVTTVAARADNPELVAARERGVEVIVRAEMVQRLLEDLDVLAIAGSHGKTTTTAMVALMAVAGGLDPLVLLGGDSPDLGGNVRVGSGAYAVVEADEFAEAFLEYTPKISLITNVEADHLDYFGDEQRLIAAFDSFAGRVRDDGTLLVCADSPTAATIGSRHLAAGARVERYGLVEPAEWRAAGLRPNDQGGLDCTVILEGSELGPMSTRVPGRHNVSNALGALAVAMRAGVDFKRAAQAAATFSGTKRRFELMGEIGGVTLLDDYGHHPTEIRATVTAARQRFPGRRLVACFQPHTYSRSLYLLDGFRTCFEGLDMLVVVPTFAARETPDAGIDGETLAREIERPVPVYLESLEAAAEFLAEELQPGDVCITFGGGGNVEDLHPLLHPLLRARLEGQS